MVQAYAEVGHRLLRLGKDVVVEVDEHVLDDRARVAQRLAKIDLRAAVGGEVLDQQRARALANVALNLCIAAETLGLLAHVLHGQAEAVGDPRGIGKSRRLAAGDAVELPENHNARDRVSGEEKQLGEDGWIKDELVAVDKE